MAKLCVLYVYYEIWVFLRNIPLLVNLLIH